MAQLIRNRTFETEILEPRVIFRLLVGTEPRRPVVGNVLHCPVYLVARFRFESSIFVFPFL